MKKKTKVQAVYKEDLQKLLESINEFEPINNGERICMVCSKIITNQNIQLVIPRKSNEFEYVCDSPICVEEYNRKKKVKNE